MTSTKRSSVSTATPKKPTVPGGQPFEHDVILGAIPHPVLVIGADDHVVYANAAAEQFFSTSQSLLKRQRLQELTGPSSPLMALLEQVRRTGTTVNEYGVDVALPRVAATRLIDVYGGFLPEHAPFIMLMLQQRSMAQMIERQLTHRAAARSVSGMAAMLAHEIKNPLSGIRGAAQLLEPALGTEDRTLTHLICTETERIRALVDRMEVFGDERPLEKAPINVHAVLDHVKRLATSGFARQFPFIEDYDPSLPAIHANRDKLVQALLNLVKNAAEALEAAPGQSGTIVLRTGFRPGVRLALPGSQSKISLPFMIEIEDNGAGISDSIRQSLFDPFVTTKSSGTGLGLALVAKIISDHGGIVECESAPKHTVFRILLPLADGGVPARSTPTLVARAQQ
jgi:two-component system, NtrC family, nitrogen regulation sensor histidine kinase GlnL